MTSAAQELSIASELARSLDASMAQLLPVAALVRAAEHDEPLPEETQSALRALGWSGICVAEDDGGLGLDVAAQVKLAAVAGRRLLPAAIQGETFALAPVLAACSARELLEGVLAGELVGGGAAVDAAGTDLTAVTTTVALAPGGRLVALVGEDVTAVLDLAEDPIELAPIAALDIGQGATRIRITGPLPADRVVTGPMATQIRRRWELAAFGHAYGAAQRSLELSIDHATQREQFGRRIVTFQAVSHRLADMAVALASLEAAIGRLAASARSGRFDDPLAAVLRHAAPSTARTTCESAIQVHGGMGFTWEYGLHLYLRRVLDLQYSLGGAAATAQAVGVRYLAARAGSAV